MFKLQDDINSLYRGPTFFYFNVVGPAFELFSSMLSW